MPYTTCFSTLVNSRMVLFSVYDDFIAGEPVNMVLSHQMTPKCNGNLQE